MIEHAWIVKLFRDAAFTLRLTELLCRLKKWLFFGESCYLNSTCIIKSHIRWQMFLLVSGRHIVSHPDVHQHGVPIQISINFGKIFLWISRIRILPWPVACVIWRFCRAFYWAAKQRGKQKRFCCSLPNLLAVSLPPPWLVCAPDQNCHVTQATLTCMRGALHIYLLSFPRTFNFDLFWMAWLWKLVIRP